MAYFEHKSALVTGAGSGIGRALAIELNRLGCDLWLIDIDDASLKETSKFLTKQTANYETRLVDTSCRTSIEKLAVEIEQHKGCIDILINNAGVGLGATFEEMKLEDFKWLMNINFWGVVYGCLLYTSPSPRDS